MDKEKADRLLFDAAASVYIKKDRYASSVIPRKKMLRNALAPWMKRPASLGTILDIGCGVGAPAKYLMGYYRKYVGIDQSRQMIDAARVFNRHNRSADFICGNIKSLDWPDRSFDLILSLGALHHMTDLDSVMSRIHRLSKPGGMILVIEPQSSNPVIQLLRRIRIRIDPRYSREQIFFSESELTVLFERHHIQPLVSRYAGFLSTPFAEVVFHPQFLFVPLSMMATAIDTWLYRHLPRWLGRMSYKIVLAGRIGIPGGEPSIRDGKGYSGNHGK